MARFASLVLPVLCSLFAIAAGADTITTTWKDIKDTDNDVTTYSVSLYSSDPTAITYHLNYTTPCDPPVSTQCTFPVTYVEGISMFAATFSTDSSSYYCDYNFTDSAGGTSVCSGYFDSASISTTGTFSAAQVTTATIYITAGQEKLHATGGASPKQTETQGNTPTAGSGSSASSSSSSPSASPTTNSSSNPIPSATGGATHGASVDKAMICGILFLAVLIGVL